MQHSLRVLAIVASITASATAQLRWVDATPHQSPAPRYGHAAGSRYLIFGGRNDTQLFSDTWAYGTDGVHGDTWTQVPVTMTPPGRYDHAAASMVRDLLVFGGRDLSGAHFDDTWLLVGSWVAGPPHVWQGAWQQINSAQSPSGRHGHAMAFDYWTNTECLLFGGHTDQGLSGETWMFANGQWEYLPIAGPSPREGHAMVAEDDHWLLYGGETASGTSREVWKFDGTSWQQLADMPFAAAEASTVFLPWERRRQIFVGGSDETGQLRSDLFERTEAGVWLHQEQVSPLAPRTDSVVLDHLHFAVNSSPQFTGSALVFGGRDASGTVLGDTKLMEPVHVSSSEHHGTGCGPGAWGDGGPDVFMQRLILGSSGDVSVYTRSSDVPVLLGVKFGEVVATPTCQVVLTPDVTLLGIAIGGPLVSIGTASFPVTAPFSTDLRGFALSMQALALEPASPNGLSLSNLLVVRIGD